MTWPEANRLMMYSSTSLRPFCREWSHAWCSQLHGQPSQLQCPCGQLHASNYALTVLHNLSMFVSWLTGFSAVEWPISTAVQAVVAAPAGQPWATSKTIGMPQAVPCHPAAQTCAYAGCTMSPGLAQLQLLMPVGGQCHCNRPGFLHYCCIPDHALMQWSLLL